MLKSETTYHFSLTNRERNWWVQILNLFPMVPAAQHKIQNSQEAPKSESMQSLLDESLAEHRSELSRKIEKFLNDASVFQRRESGWLMVLPIDRIDWILQVLNDVRVGCWIALGEPDATNLPVSDPLSLGRMWAMQCAGHFQSVLLQALGISEPAESEDL